MSENQNFRDKVTKYVDDRLHVNEQAQAALNMWAQAQYQSNYEKEVVRAGVEALAPAIIDGFPSFREKIIDLYLKSMTEEEFDSLVATEIKMAHFGSLRTELMRDWIGESLSKTQDFEKLTDTLKTETASELPAEPQQAEELPPSAA